VKRAAATPPPGHETGTVIEVCAAMICDGHRVLLATRPAHSHLAGKWEFPGGKKRTGESDEACIRRELREELGLDPVAIRPLASLTHEYPAKRVHLHFLHCTLAPGAVPHSREGQQLGWFPVAELNTVDLAAADRRFVEEQLTARPCRDA